jgi:hypothetical protein
MEKSEKGYITLLLLVLIGFGYLMSGGFMPLISHAVTDPTAYALVDPPLLTAQKTLQLQSLTFVQGACDPGYLESGEPGILYAAKPGPNDIAGGNDSIRLWYTDEHAVTLGVGSVSPMVNHPADTIANPNVGDLAQKDSFGFPLFPALFITDVTFDPKNTSGDAQNGGTPIPPSIVYGSWKESNGSDPNPENGLTLPAGAEAFPSSPSIIHSAGSKVEQGYGALIVWTISSLGLAPGHSYRAQFVVHDGDNNRTGGDIGIGCTTIRTYIPTQ